MARCAFLAAITAVSAAACATTASDEISEKAAARLAEFEATGETQACLSTSQIRQITPLDERHFLIRTGVNDYYLNVTSRCASAHRSNYRIQYQLTNNRLCRNQIITVVDNTTGITAGSCGLGDFERLEPIAEDEKAGTE